MNKEELLDEVKNRLITRAEDVGGLYGGRLIVDWKKIEQVIDQLKSDD
jgi:hypothetical protein